MAVSAKSNSKTLKHAPILEAIFEMRWELPQIPNTQVRRDPAYPLLYGRLYDRFKKDYAIAEDLPSVQVHPDANPYVVRHRMRKAADEWPIAQVGPGIITINESKGYSWDSFRHEIVRIFEAFTDFYPASTFPLNILKTELRFINGVEVDAQEGFLNIFKDKLHTRIELPDGLFLKNKVQPKPEGLTLNAGFKIDQPPGHAMIGIGSGAAEDKPAIIQQMLFQSIGENAPQDLGSLDPWLDSMHGIALNWFETLFAGELLKKFS